MTTDALNILVVEDELSIRSLMEMEFQDLGYNTISTGLVAEAMAVINENPTGVDLCIIDLRLPDGDGLSLLQYIKERLPHVPVILMTGHGNKSTVIEALKRGATDYIEKPFSISNDLFPVIHRVEAAIKLQKENNSLNEQILHQSKLAALGELSATVLHDIRGPLSLIQIVCDDMSEEIEVNGNISPDTLQEHIANIRKACDRIRKLVEHLRTYSRQDNKEQMEDKQLDLLIEDSLFLVQQKIRKFNIKVNRNFEALAPRIMLHCKPNKFEQVIMNLCSNACDAMSTTEKRELTIDVRKDETNLYIDITDTGTGMSKEIQEKLFENFFTTKPRGEGTGLGLKIVRNIIKEHNGELLLESEVGKGTTFTIKVPLDHVKEKDHTFVEEEKTELHCAA